MIGEKIIRSYGLPEIERFERLYVPVPECGCWIWLATIIPSGHGSFRTSKRGNGGAEGAHRAAWRLYRGEIPEGKWVLHHCDTPACVNPDHLYLGDRQDNANDLKTRGGGHRGETHRYAILNDALVREIRNSDEKATAIARRLGVSKVTIYHVRKRRTWTHVT
jgi:hypothetical protein